MIESYNRKKLSSQQETAMLNQYLALQISEFVGALLSKDVKPRNVTELLPELFKTEEIENKKREIELQQHKERMRQFALRYNANRMRKE